MMNNKPGDRTLPGITCDVINCAYHHDGRKCSAKEITVGPQYANSSTDTVCDTFKPDNNATM